MKKFTLLLLLFAVFQIVKAQTVLQPGDIAIVQVNASYNSFDFVSFVDIEAGTIIYFTDYAYSTVLNGLNETTTYDGVYKFTASEAIPAGKVVQYKIGSTENPQFTTIKGSGSGFNYYSMDGGYFQKGENLIIYQGNYNYLFAMGWMRKDNFSPNPSILNEKVCDIPSGLSKSDYTVIQIDSVMKPGLTPVTAKDFRYSKYEGYTGTAYMIRHNLSNTENYNNWIGSSNNDAVSDFVILPPDTVAPQLQHVYPANNAQNVSARTGINFDFNEKVIVQPAKIAVLRNLADNSTSYYGEYEVQLSGKRVTILPVNKLTNNTSYRIEIPEGYFADENANTWPEVGGYAIEFQTSAPRSVLKLDFLNDPKENIQWHTDSISEGEKYGYWSFSIKGIPMRQLSSTNEVEPTPPYFFDNNFPIYMTPGKFTIDTHLFPNSITNVRSQLYENCVNIVTEVFGNQSTYKGEIIGCMNQETLPRRSDYFYDYQSISNENNEKIDSIKYSCLEGWLLQTELEMVDTDMPVVELGANLTICEGDSVTLDAGFMPGVVYDWNTGATTQKITVKTTDTYSVTVKNTLGQRSDNVLVTVRPTISVSLPDTIHACVGDTVTLTAGTDTSNSYFWTPNGQTTPSIKVTKNGIYHVLVNNGFGGCFTTDSSRVIFKGAKAHVGFNQGGMTGYNDVEGQLYKKSTNGKFEMFVAKNLPQFATFDSLPKGEYILKAHFVSYSFVGTNPFIDTYHDGKTEWSKVVPFKLTCETDTMFSFSLANKPSGYEFNGTGVISGKVVVSTPAGVRAFRVKSEITDINGDMLILLYDGSGNLIATTYPDAYGNYSFTNLPAGNYSIGVERTGFTVQTLFTTSLPTGGTVSNANFTVNVDAQSIVQGLTTGISTISSRNFLQLSISPNPIKSSAKLEISSQNVDNITISVVDFTGRICKSLNRTIEQGVNVITLNNDGFSGIYLVKVSTSTKMLVQRVIFE